MDSQPAMFPESPAMANAPPVPASPSISFRLGRGEEILPGYVLRERIGCGGYGEVWSAVAPGGLLKAVKFVYGREEDAWASRELKSLRHAKALRHPFLLTLERIEIVDGHLVVVMELAESNLKLRLREARRAGLPGIPRDELLGYLHEAAEALDYLWESHSLQHLDVKPENLLLVGRHVKVGDFGLLKQLRDTSVSVISGLTPAYASPEVFDGKPGPRSDQYSLAIVYQELATGALPFRGQSAAALAAQHVHGEPDLSGLAPHERFAIGKALSRDPARRFGSCRELIARLAQRGSGAVMTGLNPPGASRGDAPEPNRVAADQGWTPVSVHDGQTISTEAEQPMSLAPLALEGMEATYRPTVFVGVGGTGGRVLIRLRRLLMDRYGDSDSWPALRLLWIDTDVAAIESAASRDGQKGLREEETLAVPLKQSWHYRNGPLGKLPSLSRRWIYNIPRTLRTEGLRPLGRLALLDHAPSILEALRRAVASAADPEAVAATAQHTGLPFRPADPRVFVVASIAGGTGGGMMPDLAYAVRQVLMENGFSDADVSGLLVYSSRNADAGRNLAPASAYACLHEMHYFSLPGSEYPGEPSCKLAGFRGAGPSFKNTYLVDLGDQVGDGSFEQHVDQMATYLLLNAVSPASVFFDQCRAGSPGSEADGEFSIRTLGLTALSTDTQPLLAEWTERLCRTLVRRWQGEADRNSSPGGADYAQFVASCASHEPSRAIADTHAAELLAASGVTPEQLIEGLRTGLDRLLGEEVDVLLKRILSEGLAADRPIEEILGRLHALTGILDPGGSPEMDRPPSLRQLGESEAARRGAELGEAMQDRLARWVNAWEASVADARRAADALVASLDSLETALRQRFRGVESRRAAYLKNLLELAGEAQARRLKRQELLAEHLPGYSALVVDGLLAELAARAVRSMRSAIAAGSEQLRDLWKDLNRLCEDFAVSDAAAEARPAPAALRGDGARFLVHPAELFAGQSEAMVRRLDREMKDGFFSAKRRLSDLSFADAPLRHDLLAAMRLAARKVLLQCVRDADLAWLRESLSGDSARSLDALLEHCRESAMPRLLPSTGGALRWLLVVPEGLDGARLAEEVQRSWGDRPTVIPGEWGETLLCCEAERLALARVCGRLLQSRPDCRELASRLHSRLDVNW